MATYGNNKPWRAQEIPNGWRHWTWFFWIPGSAFQPVWKNCWVLELWYLAPSGTLESRKAFLPKPLMSLIPHCSQLRQCMRAPSNLEYIIIISRLCWLRPEAYLNPSEPKKTSLTTLLLQMFMVWICLDGVWINILASSTGFVNNEGFVFAAMLLLWDLGLAVYKFGTMIYSWFIERLPFPPSYASFRESWFREIVCLPTNAKPHPSAAASASAHILPRQWGFCSQPEKSENNKSSIRPKLQQHWKYQQDFQHLQSSSVGDCWKCMEMFDLLRPWPLSPQHFWQCPCRSQMLSWDPSCWWLDPLTSHQRPGKNTKRWCCWHQCPRRRSETQSSKETKQNLLWGLTCIIHKKNQVMTRLWHVMTMTQVHPSLRYLRFAFAHVSFLHISAYFYIYFYARLQQQQPCQESRSWGSHPLRWSRRPFGPWAAPRHLCRWIPAFATPVALLEGRHSWPAPGRQAARLGILRSKLSTKRILSYNICIISYIDSQGKLQFRKLLWRSRLTCLLLTWIKHLELQRAKGSMPRYSMPSQDWLACFGIFHSHPFTTNTNVTLSKAFKTNTDWWPTLPKTKLPWSDSDWSAFPGLVLVCANSPCRLGATRMGEAWKKQKNNSRKSYCYFSTHQKQT